MAMSSVSVVTNALRLRRFNAPATAHDITHRPLRTRVADSAYLVAIAVVASRWGRRSPGPAAPTRPNAA